MGQPGEADAPPAQEQRLSPHSSLPAACSFVPRNFWLQVPGNSWYRWQTILLPVCSSALIQPTHVHARLLCKNNPVQGLHEVSYPEKFCGQ